MKEKIAPYIKLKYFRKPKDSEGADNFICFQCKKRSMKIGSCNVVVNPPEYHCEQCAIFNYAQNYGFKSLEVAESYRRRMFDVFYLFQEMLINRILKEEKKTFKELTDEEYSTMIELANDMWKDKKLINQREKENLESLYYQKDIEEEIDNILDSVSLHRVDFS
jgi:hypothetical protein